MSRPRPAATPPVVVSVLSSPVSSVSLAQQPASPPAAAPALAPASNEDLAKLRNELIRRATLMVKTGRSVSYIQTVDQLRTEATEIRQYAEATNDHLDRLASEAKLVANLDRIDHARVGVATTAGTLFTLGASLAVVVQLLDSEPASLIKSVVGVILLLVNGVMLVLGNQFDVAQQVLVTAEEIAKYAKSVSAPATPLRLPVSSEHVEKFQRSSTGVWRWSVVLVLTFIAAIFLLGR